MHCLVTQGRTALVNSSTLLHWQAKSPSLQPTSPVAAWKHGSAQAGSCVTRSSIFSAVATAVKKARATVVYFILGGIITGRGIKRGSGRRSLG